MGHVFQSLRKNKTKVWRLDDSDMPMTGTGIIHTIYARKGFRFRLDYLGFCLYSTPIDKNNHMMHFPSGVPIHEDWDFELEFTDKAEGIFEVHWEECPINWVWETFPEYPRVQLPGGGTLLI
jgi:hypothetical protein